jgi:hypothetical protein
MFKYVTSPNFINLFNESGGKMAIEPGQIRRWHKNYGDCTFLVLSLEDEVYENGDGVNGFKLTPVAWVLEQNGNRELYEVEALEFYSDELECQTYP